MSNVDSFTSHCVTLSLTRFALLYHGLIALSVSDLFGFDPDTILKTSARARIGIKEVNAI